MVFNIKEYNKKYWLKNKARLTNCNKLYYQKNKESQKKKAFDYRHNPINRLNILENKKRYYGENRLYHISVVKARYLINKKNINERTKLYFKKRKSIDYNFNLRCRLRCLVWQSCNRYGNGKSYTSNKYGINFTKIIEHLKPFPTNISKYHIDYIKPLSSFDLTNPEDVKVAFAPENHQWLEAKENISKGGTNKLNYNLYINK